MCAATVIATDESMRVSSSIAIAYETVSPPAPPYSSGIGHAHQPELRELRDELVREARLAVELLGDRRDLRLRELADGAADQLLLVGELEVHATSSAELGDEPHAVAGAAGHAEVVAARALEEAGPGHVDVAHGPSPANSCRNSAASAGEPWRSVELFFMSAKAESM